MDALVWWLISLFGAAYVIDRFLLPAAYDGWRENTKLIASVLVSNDKVQASAAASAWFIDFFDRVYGAEFWSRKRFSRSIASSFFALFLIVAVIGPDNSLFSRMFATGQVFVFFVLMVLMLNPIADYISLQKTRFILELTKTENSLFELACVLLLDIIGATVIFVITLIFTLAVQSLWLPGDRVILSLEEYRLLLLGKEHYLPCFLSTYFTSAIWLLFLTVTILIRAGAQTSRFLGAAFLALAESPRPARALATLLVMPALVIFLLAVNVLR